MPTYELPLPEGVGQEQVHGGENLSMREIDETWKEKLADTHPVTDTADSNY